MDTVILTRRDIEKVLTPSVANKAVYKAFKAYGLGQADMPAKSYLYFKKGDLRTMPGYVHGQGINIAGIKSVNVHPENHKKNLPTVMAIIVLTDPENGFPLAVMDGTYITNIRTGAAGALAVRLLASKNAAVAGFVGFGVQARSQLTCIMELRRLKRILVWKGNARWGGSALSFCRWAEKTYGLKTQVSPDIDEVTSNVDILITTTSSRTALVNSVSPGTHINAIGADAMGKQEINPRILKGSKLVIDDWAQAPHSGEINVPLRKKQILKKDIYGTLGDIAIGKKQGRTTGEEITVFDSTGLAVQDMSCAFTAYKALKDKKGIKKISFF